MARRKATVKITDEGRDKGKSFLITEMSAEHGEWWATRVLLALMASNVELPDDFKQLGMAALAQLGMKAMSNIKAHDLQPLLAEMMNTVQIFGDPHKLINERPLLEASGAGEDIEEVKTRFTLRVEFWKLNMGFLQAVAQSLPSKGKAPAGKQSHTEISPK
jgi:hypothetical protein